MRNYFKYYYTGYRILYYRKPGNGSHSGNVSMHYGRKCHSGALCSIVKGKLGSKSRISVSIVIGSILKRIIYGSCNFLIILPNMLPEKNGTNVKGIAASVLTDSGSYSTDWWSVCIYYCGSIKKDFIRQAGLVEYEQNKNKNGIPGAGG